MSDENTDIPVVIEPCPAQGIHEDVPEWAYRIWDAANQSTLKTFERSAAHARYEFLNPKATQATDEGGAIHAVTLEPSCLEERYAVRPKHITDRRTKEGKAAWATFVNANKVRRNKKR